MSRACASTFPTSDKRYAFRLFVPFKFKIVVSHLTLRPSSSSPPSFLQPILFKGTVAENIAYGLEGATRDQIIAAAKAAHAHDFIMQFSDGYETDLAEGSINVSGGQKQRLAIARAIIKEAPILLLDEATSALDNESESLVQEALDDLQKQKKRTTLVIAHRLSTIRDADLIVVMRYGEIVEQGNFESLMASKNGTFAALARQQGLS
jgi:ABC-type multidrug transport system fused ATPase/permease subunit